MARFSSYRFASSLLLIPAAGLVLSACGSSTASTHDAGGSVRDTGTKSDVASPPSAYVDATLGMGATGSCDPDVPADTPFLTIGTESAPATEGAGGVSVACEVRAASAGSYTVDAQISDGSLGGFTLSGTLSDTAGPQPGFVVELTNGANGYNETDCTFTLTTEETPAVTSGRVWGTLSCPMLADDEANAVCAGSAELILQNCSE